MKTDVRISLLEDEKRILELILVEASIEQVVEEMTALWERHRSQYDFCLVALRRHESAEILTSVEPDLPQDILILGPSIPSDCSEHELLIGTTPLIVEDIENDHERSGHNPLRDMGIHGVWRLPILDSDQRLYGAILACAMSPSTPNSDDSILMEVVLNLLRIVVDKYGARSAKSDYRKDLLTGLLDRRVFLEKLNYALYRDTVRDTNTALILVNIDDMHGINHSLGYKFGDEFIISVAASLRDFLKNGEIISRVGGDEFAILIENLHDPSELSGIAESLAQHVYGKLSVTTHEIFASASLGVSIAPRDATDAETLFRHADAALHLAKASGRNSVRLYTPDVTESAARRLHMLSELRHALESSEFCVYYQPQLELQSGKVGGAEALVRWKHPRLGMVSPAVFIPLLEESGLITKVGELVLRQVCGDLKRLLAKGIGLPHIAVNLSPRQFHQQGLSDIVESILRETGIEGSRLHLEITENLIIQNPKDAVKTLLRLKNMDVSIAMDDFGTGYSSLSYLKNLPIDVLKVDKSFVDGVTEFSAEAAIVDAVMHMAHSLGMRVVAEGVEIEAQRAFLETHGCDLIQGYLYSEALDFDAFQVFLEGRDIAPFSNVSATRRFSKSSIPE